MVDIMWTEEVALKFIQTAECPMEQTRILKVESDWVKIYREENLEEGIEYTFIGIFRTKRDAIRGWPELEDYIATRTVDTNEPWRLKI